MARVLETTIRDGSYEVGFQFTRHDVATLGSLLDAAGFTFIEVGHGNGLGGEVFGSAAAASDEEYLETARRAVTRGKLGALLGFTSRSNDYILDRVRLAASSGLDFLRMGVVPQRSQDAIVVASIELAKKLGLTVSVNFMRTYCATPSEIEERSRAAVKLGVDWVYVVDSAGGMDQATIGEYVRAIGEAGPSEIGYHGHNNTQRALANSFAAIDAGATIVDTSMQGLGRATGNAQTEVVLTLLQENFNSELGIDRQLVFKLARRLIRPLLVAGFDPTDVLSGSLNVHSSSLPSLRKAAAEFDIDVDDVLARAGRRARAANALDRRDLPDEIVAEVCEALVAQPTTSLANLDAIAAHCAEHAPRAPSDAAEMLALLKIAALRNHLTAGIVVAPESWSFEGHGIYCGQGWALGVVPGPLLGELASEVDIERIFVANGVEPGSLGELAPLETFDYEALVAEAVLAGCAPSSSLRIAVSNPALRNALRGRLLDRQDVVVLADGDALDAGVGVDVDELIVEGDLGARAVQAVCDQQPREIAVTLLGAKSITSEALDQLAAANCTLRIPNIFPLLLARAAASTSVRLGERGSSAGSAVAVGSRVFDPKSDSVFGSFRPLSSRARVDDEEKFVVALERRRLGELIGS